MGPARRRRKSDLPASRNPMVARRSIEGPGAGGMLRAAPRTLIFALRNSISLLALGLRACVQSCYFYLYVIVNLDAFPVVCFGRRAYQNPAGSARIPASGGH